MISEKSGLARTLTRGVLAIAAGFTAVAVLSLGTDAIMRALGYFQPGAEARGEFDPFTLVLLYRSMFGIGGSWIAAALAPGHPMRHALAVGGIGMAVAIAWAVSMTAAEFGPAWYPWALVLIIMPCAWLGGLLAQN